MAVLVLIFLFYFLSVSPLGAFTPPSEEQTSHYPLTKIRSDLVSFGRKKKNIALGEPTEEKNDSSIAPCIKNNIFNSDIASWKSRTEP